jgi:hypothetical protein
MHVPFHKDDFICLFQYTTQLLAFLAFENCVAKVDNVSSFFSCKLESEGEYGVYINNDDLLPRVMSLCFE